jgi:sterol desaturase/sphingolipid hydroxylase (fatty acid hydroxylase superfamily)
MFAARRAVFLMTVKPWSLDAVGFLAVLAADCGLFALDFALSDAPWANLRTMAASGLSPRWSVATALLNLTGVELLMYGVYKLDGLGAGFSVHWDRGVLAQAAIGLIIGEITFTAGHRLLHQSWLARFHVMHHCCKRTSHSTNLFFHPVDLAIEFSGPIAALIAMHLLYFRDPWGLVVSATVLQVWYALDHDEHLALPHTRHHTLIDSMYTIYIARKLEGDATRDRVKALVKTAAA